MQSQQPGRPLLGLELGLVPHTMNKISGKRDSGTSREVVDWPAGQWQRRGLGGGRAEIEGAVTSTELAGREGGAAAGRDGKMAGGWVRGPSGSQCTG